MSLALLFNERGGPSKRIGILEVDVFSEETITLDNEVTDNPIETGESVTDHVYNRPVILRIRGTIAGQGFSDRKQIAYETLRELHAQKQTLDVVTGLETFSNMVIQSLDIPRTIRNSASLEFSAEFKQVRFVDSQRVNLGENASGDAADTASSSQNAGRQSTTPASEEGAETATEVAEETRPRTLLRSIVDSF